MHRYLAVSAVIFMALTSCKKNREQNTDTSTAEDQALVASMWDDAGNQTESASSFTELGSSGQSAFGACATITIDTLPGAFPLILTIDFGTENCKGSDGRLRRGKLVCTFSGPYRQSGTTITTEPLDYFLDNHRIEGLRKVTNQGMDNDSNMVFEILVENGIITTPDNETILWISTRERKWVEGINTGWFTRDEQGNFMRMDGIRDDVYTITGTGSGTDRTGRNFSVEITKELRLQLDCRWIVSGILEVVPEKLQARVLDYGSGACDNDATVSIGDRTFNVKLRG